MSTATLNKHRVISARVDIPAWGAWYADVTIDGEHALTGRVSLVIADLTLSGTVLSGGPSSDKSRSHYRIVAGAGGWGRTIPKKSYADDAGVKESKILSDAAADCGESIDASTLPTTRVGSTWTRLKEPASKVLELLHPSGWYIGEDGVTRIGSRATTPYKGKATHGPVDQNQGSVTLAAESIADILPGITVDGLSVVDVKHEISAKGLRSTVYGKRGGKTSRRLEAFLSILDELEPHRDYRAVWEYRVVTLAGERLNLQPVRVSTGMPDLQRVPVRPGVAGIKTALTPGCRVLVAFIDADPSRPVVVGFEEADGDGFAPVSLDIQAGLQVGGEHLMTVEATCLLLYNTLVALMSAAGGGPLVAATLQPLLGAAITTALAAQAVPAPPGLATQIAASTAQLAGFGTGVAPATTSQFFSAAIAALATKTPNVSGFFPSVGCKSVKAG